MSVESPRLAAAQRTVAAAQKRGGSKGRRRWIRLASWCFIVPMLSLFSFSVVASARSVGKPDYASAIKQLPSSKPVVVLENNGKPLVCSVTQSQATGLGARWRTGWVTMTFDGQEFRTLWVDGPSDHELRDFLGSSGGDCKLVRLKSLFYLPFNANLS
jgi:hypothetical protein